MGLFAQLTGILHFLAREVWTRPSREFPGAVGAAVRWYKVMALTARGFRSDKVGLHATALTLYTLLSIVPVAALAFAVSKGFGLERRLEREILGRFPEQEALVLKVMDFARNLPENSREGLIAGIGVLPLFIIWLRTGWLIVMAGSKLAYMHQYLESYESSDEDMALRTEDQKKLAREILHLLTVDFSRGRPPRTVYQVCRELEIPRHVLRNELGLLVRTGLVSEVLLGDEEEEHGYQTARDPGEQSGAGFDGASQRGERRLCAVLQNSGCFRWGPARENSAAKREALQPRPRAAWIPAVCALLHLDVVPALTESQELRRELLAGLGELLEIRVGLYRSLSGRLDPEEKANAS